LKDGIISSQEVSGFCNRNAGGNLSMNSSWKVLKCNETATGSSRSAFFAGALKEERMNWQILILSNTSVNMVGAPGFWAVMLYGVSEGRRTVK
jgi:hypothetical protein